MKKIEHIGIAVKNLDRANELFSKLLGKPNYKTETVESEQVDTSFFRIGETKIELVATSDENNNLNKFIDKRGEGIHHIAFAVDDIEQEMKRLRNQGFRVLQEEPVKGADNKRVCFLHPKSTNGVLVELCQEIK